MAYTPPFMLATGDYEGRICIWNIHTGERRCTLTHEAPEHQRGVEQLLFLRASAPSASPILLSCGGKLPHCIFLNLSCEAFMKPIVVSTRVGKVQVVRSQCRQLELFEFPSLQHGYKAQGGKAPVG